MPQIKLSNIIYIRSLISHVMQVRSVLLALYAHRFFVPSLPLSTSENVSRPISNSERGVQRETKRITDNERFRLKSH